MEKQIKAGEVFLPVWYTRMRLDEHQKMEAGIMAGVVLLCLVHKG